MTEASGPSIHLAFPFTLVDRIRAAFALIPQRPANIVIHSIIPLIGLGFLALILYTGRSLSLPVIVVVAACLFITPFFTVIAVVISYAFNPIMREPFTYTFDDRGIHVNAVTHEFTHHWSAISRVKRFAGFMLFFFGPGLAHCIPLSVIQRENVGQSLLDLAKRHGAKVQ